MRQHAEAAAEIGPASGKFRQLIGEQSGSGIDSVPGEHARLGPKAQRFGQARRAGANRGLDRLRVAARLRETNSVVALGGFDTGAAEIGQILGQASAALVLGRERQQRRARFQRPQGEREGGAALDGAGRREHGEIFKARSRFQPLGAGRERRELSSIVGDLREFRRRRAENIFESHGIP